MKRFNVFDKIVRLTLASSLTGSLFMVGCLGRVAGVGQTLGRNINPCGTIVDCDPVEWDFMFNDYPDWDLDPTCTIGGMCDDVWPPTSDGAGSGGNNGTNTNNNTNNNNTNDNTNQNNFVPF